MRKLIYSFIVLASLPMMSCTPDDETASSRKAIGPSSDESDMPWNRPTGPEGAGALGILNDQ